MKNKVVNYAKGIINSSEHCLYVKQAAKRFLNDLENEAYYFDEKALSLIVNFIQSLYLNTSPKKKFILEKWQLYILANIYAIKRKSDNTRKYRYVYIEIPRKNGKSELITVLSLIHLIFDDNATITVSANSREQAKNVDFKKIKAFAKQIDPREKHLIPYYNALKFIDKNNEIIVTSSDAKRLDGLNISTAIIDELHAAKDSSVYDVIKSAMGSQPEPLLIVITTAGFDTDGFCYQLRDYVINVISGVATDEAQFGIIYTLDEGDNYEDEKTWIKANPNLGVSVTRDFLSNEVNKAKNNQSEGAGVKVKNFNLWQKKGSVEAWIGEKYLTKALTELNLNDYKGAECVVGVDLGTNTDITALSVCIKDKEGYTFFNRYYLPADSLNTHANKRMYKEWSENGYIYLTEGNVTDYNYILKDLLKISTKLRIKQVNYDKYNATQWAIDATESGFNLKPFSQNALNYNIPTKEFERLILMGRLRIEKSPVTKYMLNNVILKVDLNGNVKPIRNNENKKIDGVMAMLMALGGYVGQRETNIYIV